MADINTDRFNPLPSAGDKDAGDRVKNDTFDILQYPIKDLGGGQHRHVMRIGIFTQNVGSEQNRNTGIVPGNRFDQLGGEAGSSYNPTGTTRTGGALAVGGKGLENVRSLVSGGLSLAANFMPGMKGLKWAGIAAGVDAALGVAQGAITGGFAIAKSNLDVGAKLTSKEALAYINMYMPETLNFVNQQDFDAVSLTEAMGLAGRLSQPGGVTSAENQLAIAAGAGIVGDRYRDFYLQKNAGYALNPQLEILYAGPKNREFVFSFKFTPRSAAEASEVWKIIRTLRFHAAPEYASEMMDGEQSLNSRHIVPPSQFDISFWAYPETGGNPKENTNLPRIGRCVLSNIDVNYAPTGKFSAFYDGMPVEIQLQLSFTEMVILTKEDIRGGY